MFHAIHGFKQIFFRILVLLLFITSCAVDGYAIVFVHLGNTLPDYLADATHQARLFNSAADIIVVAEKNAFEHVEHDQFVQDDIIFVACEELVPSDTHQLFLQKTSLDTTFREGFWRKCAERFYYIEELMDQHNISDVFHLEYDNMLYVDLQELLPIFHTYPNIAATFDNDDRCIAGFIYFRRVQAAKKLARYLTKMCKSGLNEMQMLARYRKICGESEIGTLPIIMPSYLNDNELRTPSGHKAALPKIYSVLYEKFNSVFDAAALGQYLGGQDPRNGLCVFGFINESCVFNPSKLAFKWAVDKKGRKVPYVRYKKQKCRINNLHIHSKNLKRFAS